MTRYRVTPGTIAGMGDPDLAIQRLRHAGWKVQHNACGHAWAWSPDGRIRVGYQPDTDPDDPNERHTWTVEVYRHPEDRHTAWMLGCSEETPIEVVAAVIDEVVDTDPTRLLPADDDPAPSASIPAGIVGVPAGGAVPMRMDPGRALQPVTAAGWAAGSTGTQPEIEAWSPDERVYAGAPIDLATRQACLVHAYGEHAHGGVRRARQWNALIDMATPVEVAARFFDALQAAYHAGVLRDDDTPPPAHTQHDPQ